MQNNNLVVGSKFARSDNFQLCMVCIGKVYDQLYQSADYQM